MTSSITRRQLLAAGGRIAAVCSLPGGVHVGRAMAADASARMTSGLRDAAHSISWLGAEAGVFTRHGVDVRHPVVEMGATLVGAGMASGELDFATFGILPVAESFLTGGDAVALLRATLPHQDKFIAARREHATLSQLAGKRVGLISDAYTGQSGVQTRLTLEKEGVTATYVRLGTFENIYAALGRGEIDAGLLPIHMRMAGQRQHGWNIFEVTGLEADVPTIFGTRRQLIASNRDLVMRVMKGYLQAIHGFKTRPDVFVPALQRFLEIDDRATAEDLHRYYVPLFPRAPRVALAGGMPAIRDSLSRRYPAARDLKESDISDSSFLDELEQSGFVEGLYAAGPR
jgi:ABC-type nitrate/sulfonate/bicarbonate transport system substrate-binding protein